MAPSPESVFVLGVIAMLVLPPVIMAQGQHNEMKVTIVNGDTTINGKNIKELTAADRKAALKAVDELGKITLSGKGGLHHLIVEK